ncbi:hypothetical protein ACJZ2D_007262 [Fusarium nematophilum]
MEISQAIDLADVDHRAVGSRQVGHPAWYSAKKTKRFPSYLGTPLTYEAPEPAMPDYSKLRFHKKVGVLEQDPSHATVLSFSSSSLATIKNHPEDQSIDVEAFNGIVDYVEDI